LFHSPQDERRRNKRFIVKGQARLRLPSGSSPDEVLEVVDLSGGGMLVFGNVSLPVGMILDIRFTVQGYLTELQAKGRIVRTDRGVLGFSFTEDPPGMAALLAWLEAGVIGGMLGA